MNDEFVLRPIAYFHSPFASKFGIPKQSGVVPLLAGTVVFESAFRDVHGLRGIEGFDYLWLVWKFSANPHDATHLLVRPPLLGGNEKVGVFAIVIDAIVVTVTVCGGVFIGKLLRMDRGIALLTSVGSGICGAAAVLGAESALQVKPYKTAVAVSTVVIFGTLSMFLYPVLYRNGIFDLSPDQMGLMTGATVHEVAHVVGAANAMGKDVSNSAIIVKMIRVMMLVPVLLILGWNTARYLSKNNEQGTSKAKITIPWFAILFLVVIGFNSFNLLPVAWVEGINQFDTFLLTMAMTALGAETSFDKFKKAGAKPFLLAAILFVWLIGGGYCLAKYVVPMMMNI